MKTQFLAFIHQLSVYDYLLFGGVLFFFLFSLALAILFHHKLKLAIALILFAFVILTVGPPIGYFTLHHYLYKHTITLQTVKDLQFTDALVIKGEVKNVSNFSIQECTLHIGVAKKSPYALLNRLYPYIPFRRTSMKIKGPINSGESENFKLLIEPFRYSQPHTVTVRGVCR